MSIFYCSRYINKTIFGRNIIDDVISYVRLGVEKSVEKVS